MIRILHVDDSQNDLELTKINLKKLSSDLEIEWCDSAGAALERLAREKFHCVVSDYRMPDRDGIDFLRELRATGDETPFIFFTGHGTEEVAAEALRCGADDYFVRDIGLAAYERLYYGIKRAADAQMQKEKQLAAEQALQESEVRFRNLFETSKDVVYTSTRDGQLIDINPSGAELFGYTLEEMLTMTVPSLYADSHQREEFSAEIEQTGFVKDYPIDLRRKDGSTIHCLLTSTLRYDEKQQCTLYQGIIRDITEQRWMEDTLRKLSGAVEQSTSAIVMTDTEGRIEYVNPKVCELTGLSFNEVVGEIPHVLSPEHNSAAELEERWNALKSGQEWRGEIEHVNKDGQVYWEYVHISPLKDRDGRATSYLIASEEITELVQAREQLEAANTELAQINAQLEEAIGKANRLAIESQAASIAKSQFLANMSHEIRTPLNGIMGMTELMLETGLNDEQREYLELTYESATSLLTLINDILDFSKIEAGKLEIDPIPFRLRDCIGDTMRGLALRSSAKGIEMAVRILPDVPDAVVGDPGRLRQILINLVGNAIKFTDEGEVVVTVEVEEGSGDAAVLRFSVSDTGIGIEKSKVNRIFEAFQQADGSTTREYGGTGLGLTICSQLVSLMGGRIWVESEVGKGSTFRFTIKFGLHEDRHEEPLVLKSGLLEGTRILAVDDNATNRKILVEMLAHWRSRAEAASSGEEALKALRSASAAGDPFKLIVVDSRMPFMDGFALVEQIVADEKLAGIKIMMLTSAGNRGDAARCRRLGVAAYLYKPLKETDLIDAISAVYGMAEEGAAESGLLTRHSLRERRRKLRILLAEDNHVNQMLATKLLEKRGYQVTVVGDGLKAVRAFESGEFDLILMDVQMPEMDGLAAAGAIRLRERKTGEHIPIIAMTAHAMKGDRDNCLEAGMDEYIAKPIRASELYTTIDRLVSGQAAGRSRDAAAIEIKADDSGFDFIAALDSIDGDKGLFEELMGLFLEDYPQRLEEIEAALEKGDSDATERAAHTLKGAAGSLGLSRIQKRALQLEEQGRASDLVQAGKTLESLRAELEKLNLFCSREGWLDSI